MERVELVEKYFINRTDLAPVKNPGFAKAPYSRELVEAHFRGDIRVGAYQLEPNTSKVRWACLDFDQHEKDGQLGGLADPRSVAEKYRTRLKAMGLRPYLESSGGGRGFHLWVFFDEPIAAAVVRDVFLAIVDPELCVDGEMRKSTSGGPVEVFPKQSSIELGGFGNLVWLPWWGKAAAGGNEFDEDVSAGFEVSTRAGLLRVATIPMLQERIQKLAPSPVKTEDREPSDAENLLPLEIRQERFARYLEAAGPAIQGSGGDIHTFNMACVGVLDFLLTEDECFWSMSEWNASCDPPWEDRDLMVKIRNAARKEPSGKCAYGFSFDPEAVDEFIAEQNEIIRELKAKERAQTVVAGSGRPNLPPSLSDIFFSDEFLHKVEPIKTHCGGLDELTGGLMPRNITVLAGPPGSGKTGLQISWATRLASEGMPVLFVQLEVDRCEMAARVVSQMADVAPRAIVEHLYPVEKSQDFARGLPAVRILCMEPNARTLNNIAEALEAVEAEYGRKPLLCVDFLQLLVPGGAEIRQAVGNIAYGLKQMAVTYDIAVLAVTSVSRSFYGGFGDRNDSESPTAWLAAGKESGDIEFAAGTFIYLDVGQHNDTDGYSPARLIVAKARQGRTGFVGMRFYGKTGQWVEDTKCLFRFGEAAKAAKKDENKEKQETEREAKLRSAREAVLTQLQIEPRGKDWFRLHGAGDAGSVVAVKAVEELLLEGVVEYGPVTRNGRTYQVLKIKVPGGQN